MRRIAWILFLCVTLVGCSKNNAVIPVEPPVTMIQPKVVLSITPEDVVLPYGSVVNLSWIATDASMCVINSNETVQVSGTKNIQLFADAQYSIVAVSGKLTSTPVEKSVKIGDWTTSQLGLLTYDGVPWMTEYMRVFQDNKMVADLILDQYQKTNMYYFMLDNHIKMIESSGVTNTSGEWYFSNDSKYLLMGKDKVPYLLEKLTRNEIVFSYPTDYLGKPAVFQITYYRPGLK